MVVLVEQCSTKVATVYGERLHPLTSLNQPLPFSTRNKDNLVCLKKGGPSGLVTMLIGLKWWALICNKDVKWLAAFEDVKACMEDFVGSGSKCKGEENERVGRNKGWVELGFASCVDLLSMPPS